MPNRLLSPGDSATRSLDAQIHQLLARMSVLSEVPAARTGDIVHGGEQSTAPKGPRRSMYDEFRARYQGARSDRARRLVIEDAERALLAVRKTPDTEAIEPERWSFLWKCRIADDARDIEKIKETYFVSQATVYRYRAKYARLRRLPSAA